MSRARIACDPARECNDAGDVEGAADRPCGMPRGDLTSQPKEIT